MKGAKGRGAREGGCGGMFRRVGGGVMECLERWAVE